MSRGFTLIELVVTLAILALLASVAAPLAETAIRRTKEQELATALRQIREGLDAYKKATDEGRVLKSIDESGYPKTLDLLASGVKDAKSPDGRMIYFLRRLPADPMATEPGLTAAQTWAIRSYASPPDTPKEGNDVYDIHSKSEGVGLNGVPYKEW